MVSVGQIVVLILLCILCLHCVKRGAVKIEALFISFNDKWRKRSLAEIHDINDDLNYDGSYDRDDPYAHLEPWEYDHEVQEEKLKRREDAVTVAVQAIRSFLDFVLDYALVLATGAIAVFKPELLGQLVNIWLSK